MNQNYRWYRQDEITRKSIITNAVFATQNGFKTTQEPNKPDIKTEIDKINKQVNLDKILYTAQINRSIHGKAAFEIIRNRHNTPTKLLSLNNTRIKPDIDENWTLTGYTYQGKENFYQPDEILYFINHETQPNHQGISDIEPIRTTLETRHTILRENIPEITRTLWAPYVILKADTTGLPNDEAEQIIENLAQVARAGKSIAINESIEATVVNLTPDIQGLNTLLTKLEESIIANFGVPRFLLGKPVENRATAYAELEAYINGPITSTQRYLRREIEAQLYTPITQQLLQEENQPPDKVTVKHKWNPVRATDFYRLAEVAAKLWGPHGTGPLGGDKEKIWQIMNWNPEELKQ
jgi:phage portal protein BeeE